MVRMGYFNFKGVQLEIPTKVQGPYVHIIKLRFARNIVYILKIIYVSNMDTLCVHIQTHNLKFHFMIKIIRPKKLHFLSLNVIFFILYSFGVYVKTHVLDYIYIYILKKPLLCTI